ncbi:MAG: NAD(P)/FAD-dependent oxidoreductase [Anaerolineae bacterium]|nr:NAD(P)/FAD-dependent oxidoreductase [Anaerolineae bacterium]
MNVGIIGAGITGLTAAYDLTRHGHTVTIYESRPYPGGLAAGFRAEGWDWALDRFYHHWFATDQDAIDLITELGARDRLFFPHPITSVYHQGRIYPLDSALRVLRFSPLPPIDRLRLGLCVAYLKLIRDWRALESVTAAEWIRGAGGQRTYELFWKPMLIGKFGEARYQDVNMAWLWARFHKRTSRLGYFRGGFQRFVDLLVERIKQQGGSVQLDQPVQEIRRKGDGLEVVFDDAIGHHDCVLATCSPAQLADLAPQLPATHTARLHALHSMGAAVLVLSLKQSLVPEHYWINLPASEGFPFVALVEHTNFIPAKHYGGTHIVYCGDYVPSDHAYFNYNKEQLLEAYLPGLHRINPDFQRDWIHNYWMFTEEYAQPIPLLNHSRNILPLATPIKGLWMANMSQVYPWDRGSNYSVSWGRRVAREMMS